MSWHRAASKRDVQRLESGQQDLVRGQRDLLHGQGQLIAGQQEQTSFLGRWSDSFARERPVARRQPAPARRR